MRDSNSKLEWLKFDVQTLPEDLSAMLETFREAESTANELKAEFITAFTKAAEDAGLGAPKGTEMVVSLKFKDVSIAYKEKGSTKSSVERVGFGQKPKGRTRTLTPRRS
jgi:hypothetical protein